MPWNERALSAIAKNDEVQISSDRTDGSARPYVTIWAVEVDGEVYVRSAHGPENGWFRRAVTSGTGHIRARGDDTAVRFVEPNAGEQPAIDDAYRTKYARYPGIVGGIVGPAMYPITLRLDPVV